MTIALEAFPENIEAARKRAAVPVILGWLPAGAAFAGALLVATAVSAMLALPQLDMEALAWTGLISP